MADIENKDSAVVLDHFLALVPHKRQFFSRGRVVMAVSVVTNLLSLFVAKRPGFIPLQRLLSTLLQPAENDAARKFSPEQYTAVRWQIKTLVGQLAAATEEEKLNIHTRIDTLLTLLTD